MKNLHTFQNFNEAKAKPGPDTYHRGLSDKDIDDKEDQIKKQADMDDDDPDAYKEMPGDKEAKEKGEVKKSKHTKSYDKLYGEDVDDKNESDVTISKEDMEKLHKDGEVEIDGHLLKFEQFVSESLNEEKLDASAEKGLKNKSDDTGVPIGILRDVYRRGMAAWKSGHRPGAGQQQWAYARVNSFLTKQPGTWGGADKDLAKKVRDGGHDKKLKKG